MQILPTEYYRSRIVETEVEIKKYGKRIDFYSFLRLLSVAASFILIYYSLKLQTIWLTELVFFLTIIAFAWLVKKQSVFTTAQNYHKAIKVINENELSSLNRSANLYPFGDEWINDHHPYSSDLDIFGKNTLFHLINRCSTTLGNSKLASWLQQPATVQDIALRQQLIKQLNNNPNWKQDLQASVLFDNETNSLEPSNLVHYLKQSTANLGQSLRTYITLIPYVFAALAIFCYFMPQYVVVLFGFGLANFLLINRYKTAIHLTDHLIGKAGKALGYYSDAFKLLETSVFSDKLLNGTDNETVLLSQKLKTLSGLVNRLEYKLNMFIGPVLNFFIAWDLRQFIAIENWKTNNNYSLENAFDVLAEAEALISLASLNQNYPQWCFPNVIKSTGYTYLTNGAGHPLLSEKDRITNNYNLSNTRKIDIITGSNMAGKSTFLRTLGINAVLAFCGAPACAESMEITVMNLFSYMRIRDSLSESTSTFKAELDRLQLLLTILNEKNDVFFLIDEMLRGTNSVDKYRGSKAVIEKLISEKSVGIVATHDLQLADLEKKYPDYIRNFYFDIQVKNNQMMFDYKLKVGHCTTFNASILLKNLGIIVSD